MKALSISLKRTLNVTINDTLERIKELGDKDSKALIEEYKEWIEVSQTENSHPHVLYMNQIKPNN